jgi:murein DD-endopeptidase MepM/ murein hydrolase activator NlpD
MLSMTTTRLFLIALFCIGLSCSSTKPQKPRLDNYANTQISPKLARELEIFNKGKDTEYTVAKGETLSQIARRFNVNVQSIIRTNSITTPDRILAGTRLVIPAQTHVYAPQNPTPKYFPQGFTLPVRNRKQFTSGGNELKFMLSGGEQIQAVESGRVVFISHRMLNYGNAIMISHDSGMLSFYGFPGEIRCKINENLEKGSIIGLISGSISGKEAFLVFRLFRDGTPVNPSSYLRD